MQSIKKRDFFFFFGEKKTRKRVIKEHTVFCATAYSGKNLFSRGFIFFLAAACVIHLWCVKLSIYNSVRLICTQEYALTYLFLKIFSQIFSFVISYFRIFFFKKKKKNCILFQFFFKKVYIYIKYKGYTVLNVFGDGHELPHKTRQLSIWS